MSEEVLESIMAQTMVFFNETISGLGYEVRDGQTDMALDIVDIIKDNQHIVVEAGVGIGKTFAYLVPLILYNKYSNYPVVIATSSIALQEQLRGDIEQVSKLLNEFPRVLLAKGMRNYACLKNCIDMNLDENPEKNILENFVKLVKAGEIDKANLPDVSSRSWLKLNAEKCKSSKCEYKGRCILIKDREQLKLTTGIIVTNQDMLVRNMLNRKDNRRELFNPTIKFLVVDEAHNFEEKVRNAYTHKWTYGSLRRDLNEMLKNVRNGRSELNDTIILLNKSLEILFSNFNNQIENQLEEQDLDDGARYFLSAKDVYEIASGIVTDLDTFLIQITVNEDDRYEYNDDGYENLDNFLGIMRGFIKDDSKWVYWLNRGSDNMNGVSVEVCPKRVNDSIQKLIFTDDKIKTIFTSATITHLRSDNDEESYSYFIKNTHFPLNKSEGFISSPKDSPFPYDKNSILYTSEVLPRYKDNRMIFIKEGVKEIVKLANITYGKMLVLFTSKKDMEDVYKQMKDLKLPWNLIIQDGGSSQLDILDKFKIDINSILLGTGTFWEGINIEGESLSCVVVFRLPFPVPDPIIKYKCSVSEDDMKEVLLPHMIIKLKQGIGRLIRNKSDKGIVAILDPRLGEKSSVNYKETVWEALPIKNKTNELNRVREFYDSICK